MGCDIHFIVERRYSDHWVGIYSTESELNFGPDRYPWNRIANRDYEFFGQLAGVRTAGPNPLGIPDDASELVRASEADWGMDAHSWTYMSLGDLLLTYLRVNRPSETVRKYIEIGNIKEVIHDNFPHLWLSGDLDEYRAVIWFDN